MGEPGRAIRPHQDERGDGATEPTPQTGTGGDERAPSSDRAGPPPADESTGPPGGEQTVFLNEPIDVSALPALPDDRFEPLDPRYLQIRLIGDAIAAGVVAVISIVVAVSIPADAAVARWLPLVVGAVVLVLIGLVAWLQRLEISRLGYLVRDHDFSFRKGVIGRSVTTVPFARIQHVSIDRGPLARAFGLATLQMRTAGSSGLTVAGMHHETAERLKALVVDRAGAIADDEIAQAT